MEALIFIVLVLVGVGAYVYLKNSKDKEPAEEVKPENVAPVATGTISLAPPPYPALNAKEAVALTIAKVAETKQEPVVEETPVVAVAEVAAVEVAPAPKPKATPAAKKASTPKTKKKK